MVKTSFGKFHARLRAKVVLYHMTFDSSRFRGKKGQGEQRLGRIIRDGCPIAIAVIISP